jgi:hypothetical protein
MVRWATRAALGMVVYQSFGLVGIRARIRTLRNISAITFGFIYWLYTP